MTMLESTVRPPWRGSFGRLWGSVTVSMFGSQVTVVALPLCALVTLHASPREVALLAAAGTLPHLVVGLPAGAWADRWPRRSLMVVSDWARAAALASVPLAWAADVLTLAHLFVVALVVGTFTVFFDIAALSVLPDLVPAHDLASANGHLESSRAVAHTSGPALGGGLVQALSAPIAMLADGCSYVASALLLRGLPDTPAPAVGPRDASVLQLVREGLGYCARHPYVRPLALGAAWVNLCTEAIMALLISYAVVDLGAGAGLVGAVLATANLGYLLGSVLVPRVNRALGVGRTIVLGASLNLGFLVLAAAVATTTLPLAGIAVGLFLGATGTGLWNVNAVSLRQATTPAAMMTRMNATNRFVIWGSMPLGSLLGAGLAGVLGLRETIVVCAAATPWCVVLVAFSALREVTVMPAAEVVAAGVTGEPR